MVWLRCEFENICWIWRRAVFSRPHLVFSFVVACKGICQANFHKIQFAQFAGYWSSLLHCFRLVDQFICFVFLPASISLAEINFGANWPLFVAEAIGYLLSNCFWPTSGCVSEQWVLLFNGAWGSSALSPCCVRIVLESDWRPRRLCGSDCAHRSVWTRKDC